MDNQEKEINRANDAVEETQIRIEQIKNDINREQFLFDDAKENLERVKEEKSILEKQQGDLFIEASDEQDLETNSKQNNNPIIDYIDFEDGYEKALASVFSDELKSNDSFVKPISDKIPIVTLAPDQKIRIEAHAKLGRGTEHAKWNSSNIATLTDTNKDDERILTVETTGALEPKHIILAGINELSSRLDSFKEIISDLK